MTGSRASRLRSRLWMVTRTGHSCGVFRSAVCIPAIRSARDLSIGMLFNIGMLFSSGKLGLRRFLQCSPAQLAGLTRPTLRKGVRWTSRSFALETMATQHESITGFPGHSLRDGESFASVDGGSHLSEDAEGAGRAMAARALRVPRRVPTEAAH